VSISEREERGERREEGQREEKGERREEGGEHVSPLSFLLSPV
jgi:hypothetical protein